MIIRRAKETDADALSSLAENTFRDTFSSHSSLSDMALHCETQFSPGIQRREILDSSMVTILAEVESQLAGFAQIRLGSSSECVTATRPSELWRLYVSKQWHGAGVAHNIMPEVFAAATAAQSDYIWLGVWENNPRAIAFYSKFDFTIEGEHIFHLGNDPQRDLIMMAELGVLPAV